jgi:thioredoxin reductase
MQDYSNKYCIVGAGSSGIVAAKWLKTFDIPFDIIEREDEVGGTWYFGKPNSSVYKSTHLISSKTMTAYRDFPMPADYPDYPNHRQILAYLRDYARHFGLYPFITFHTTIEHIERDGEMWLVTINGANGRETRRYKGVIIANGHLWNPKYPDYPGTFNGTTLHSTDYKTPDVLRDKRVLVIGAGNSGCDIAVEAAQNAEKTFHSTRRGYYYAPKYVFGKPSDVVNEMPVKLGVPGWIRRWLNILLLKILVGDLRNYGLKQPDHKFYESHPIVNSQILYYMGHGDISPKPDVAELCGDSVKFSDGSIELVDVIIYATGFNISFPFIDQKHLHWGKTHPELYLNVFHPEYDNLFVAGLIQSDSGQFWLVDYQSEVIARFIKAQDLNLPSAAHFKQIKAAEKVDLAGGIRYIESTRHYIEIEHTSYRNHMRRLVKLLGDVRTY